jgi:hypothetical protein
MRVRITLPPPCSLDCREFSPLVSPKCAKHARISRFFTDKPDCRERTTIAMACVGAAFSLKRRQAVRFSTVATANAWRSQIEPFTNADLTSVGFTSAKALSRKFLMQASELCGQPTRILWIALPFQAPFFKNFERSAVGRSCKWINWIELFP